MQLVALLQDLPQLEEEWVSILYAAARLDYLLW